MVHAYSQDVDIDVETYGRIRAALGEEPMPGLLVHLVVHRPEGGLRYIDVWDTVENCARAFEQRVHPAVDAAFGGRRPPAEPTVTPLEVVELRGAAAVTPV